MFTISFGKSNTVLEPNSGSWSLMKALASSGEFVTVETAMTVPAFSACVQVISESIGMLPFKLLNSYKGKTTPSYFKSEYKIFQNEANDYTSGSQFRKNMTAAYLLYGDALAEKEYALDGKTVVKMHYIDPQRIDEIYIDKKTKNIKYKIDGKVFGRDKIFHLTGLNYNSSGYKGTSIVNIGKEVLGLALAEMRFASSYFNNNGTPATMIMTKGEMTQQARENFLLSWNKKYKGAKNQNKTGILPDGIADVKIIGSDAEKSQLLESRKQTVIEIARLFRMQPHKIQSLDNATFSNIEEQGREFIQNTLMPHIILWEQSCNQQLLREEDKSNNYYKFMLDALERGKLIERYTAHNMAINGGWKTRNEIRSLEDMDNGPSELDEYVRLGNLVSN